MNHQQNHHDKLKKVIHPNEFKVALNIFDSKTDSYHPGKRHSQSKYQIVDERDVGINEIVFDFDWKSYSANYQKAKLVVEILENRNIPFIVCATGGKGIHIHTFFNPIYLSDNNKELFKEALSYGFSYRNVRLWFWNLILDEAGIDEKFRVKFVDPAPLKFNYYQGSTHLIRTIGGAKYTKTRDGEYKKFYKSYIPSDEFKSKKITITQFEEVRYPENIPTFDIDSVELAYYMNEYIKFMKQQDEKQLKNHKIKGKYTELDSVLKLLEGLGEGQRNTGAYLIAKASRIDNLPIEDAYKLISEYVKNCEQIGSNYSLKEGKSTVDWAYKHEKRFWSCKPLIELGLHDSQTCAFCQKNDEKALKILKKSNILDKIKKTLDHEIVGEYENKMLIFLLMLSKDFPSATGRPEWNLPSDPMSQNVILSSDSSSGKSWMTKKILKLFGEKEKDYFIVSRLTKNAINYYTETNMDGKIIFIEEMQGLDEHTNQLRVWMSEGSLTLNTVEKVMDETGTEINTLVNKTTHGQPVFISNQAEGIIEDQLNNRSWVIGLDTSENQTKEILNYQDKINTGHVDINSKDYINIKDALKHLKSYHFIIPFADYELMNIPINDVRSRRDYNKFLTLIKCSAYLHQKQREIYSDEKENEYIICDYKDYDIAREYSEGVLGPTFSGLTKSQAELLTTIRQRTWKDEFQISDIMRNLGKSQPYWFGMMKQLSDLGFVIADKSTGKSTIYSLTEKSVCLINLPTSEELKSKIDLKDNIPLIKELPTESTVTVAEAIPADDIKSKITIKRTDILEYMKKNIKHIIPWEDMISKFGNESILNDIITKLKEEGSIFENKPGFFMIL